MNHPHRLPASGPICPPSRPVAFALALLLAAFLGAPAAMAQRGGLPADLKAAANVKPRQGEIEKFVAGHVAQLQKGKPEEQQRARDALVREVSAAGAAPGANFMDVYSAVINKQLGPLAKSTNPRTRLNAAIVIQKVALKTTNAALADSASTYAVDPSAGVSLWATRASQSILPPLARAGKPTKLTGAIVDGFRKHPDHPDLLEDAYKALTLEFRANPQNVNPQAVPVLLPDLLKLFEFRVKQYETTTPPAPLLDERAAIFLTASRVWTHPETRKHHAAIMQQLVNLIGLAAQHAAAREGAAEREPFTNLMRRLGEALTVVSGPLKDANLQEAAKSLTEVGPNMENDALSESANGVFEAIKARFPDLKPAPEMQETAVNDDGLTDEPAAAPPDDAVPAGDEPEEAPSGDEAEQ